METSGLSPLNTRLIKNEKGELEILIASATKFYPDRQIEYEGIKIWTKYGDFPHIMG